MAWIGSYLVREDRYDDPTRDQRKSNDRERVGEKDGNPLFIPLRKDPQPTSAWQPDPASKPSNQCLRAVPSDVHALLGGAFLHAARSKFNAWVKDAIHDIRDQVHGHKDRAGEHDSS
jgi:hypothetical protein